MGRNPTHQANSDLFSTARVGDTPPAAANPVASEHEPRHVLPKDLPNAVKHLNEELDRLLAVTLAEAKRRGRHDSDRKTFAKPKCGSSSLIDTWATQRRSCCLQSWHHACADCAAVRLIPIGRAQGVEVRQRRVSVGKRELELPQASRFRGKERAARLSFSKYTLLPCSLSLTVHACDFTCRGETRKEQVRRRPDSQTRTCPNRPHSAKQGRLSRRSASS